MLKFSNPIDFSKGSCLLFLKQGSVCELFPYANIIQVDTKSKKLCVRKHKRYLSTNNILRWKTILNRLCFSETVLLCSMFCYSNMTLTKLNSISFKGDIIKTRLSGDYLSYEVSCLFNKDKLNFLKIFYGINSEKELIRDILKKMICFSYSLPYNWKRPPWKSRKKGSMQRLDFYYSDKVVIFNLLRDIIVSNKGLLVILLELIKTDIPKLYKKVDSVERRDLEKGVNFVWSSYYREELVVLIFSSLPLSYWSIYSHIIEDINLRKWLVESSCCNLVSSSNRGLLKKEGRSSLLRSDYYEDY